MGLQRAGVIAPSPAALEYPLRAADPDTLPALRVRVELLQGGNDFFHVAITPALGSHVRLSYIDAALRAQGDTVIRIDQVAHAGVVGDDDRHAAGHGLHRRQIGAGLTP